MMNNKSLSALVDQVRGVSYKPKDIHDTLNDLSIVLLRANNIFDGSVDFSDVIYIDRKRVSPSQILRRGDILVCASSGSKDLVGKAASFNCDGEYTFGAFCKVVRPKNVDDADYISMFFQSPKYRREIAASALGANINNIRNEHIDNLIINWPVKLNRDIIVSLLNQSKSIITLRKKQLQLFNELIKARFVEMFGNPILNDKSWITSSIEDVCIEIYGGGTPSKQHPEYYENGSIPWVTSKDMKCDVICDSQIHINEKGLENSTARMVPTNSIIMVIRSGILKHTLPIAVNTAPITVNQDLKVFIPDSQKIMSRFFALQLKMHESDILSGVRAVTADNIEFNELKKRKIIVPPLVSQQLFSNFLIQIDKSKVMKRLRLAHFLFVDR